MGISFYYYIFQLNLSQKLGIHVDHHLVVKMQNAELSTAMQCAVVYRLSLANLQPADLSVW